MWARCAVAMVLAWAAGGVQAHGGGLDERGCHSDSDRGRYHCHQGPLEGRSFPSETQAERANRDSASRQATDVNGSRAYDRDLYGGWRDEDGDCRDTRDEVLIDRARTYRLDGAGCEVIEGVWRDPFTGKQITDPSRVHIDHVVPLKEAHISGAATWPRPRKHAFANDSANLWAVSAAANMSKGADDPADWLPEKARCRYAEAWLSVKRRYELTMDNSERRALARLRTNCE